MDVRATSQDLTPEMILAAYPKGLFPMANPGFGIITWHCPRKRAVIPLDEFHVSRSLAYTLKRAKFTVTFDTAFAAVMDSCADRGGEDETWINDQIKSAYSGLHAKGSAHSVEVWVDGELAGGLYGVHIGGAFFAESKFHKARDMSKVALAHLVMRLRDRGFGLLEVQYLTAHLARFGTVELPHREYLRRLREAVALRCEFP